MSNRKIDKIKKQQRKIDKTKRTANQARMQKISNANKSCALHTDLKVKEIISKS